VNRKVLAVRGVATDAAAVECRFILRAHLHPARSRIPRSRRGCSIQVLVQIVDSPSLLKKLSPREELDQPLRTRYILQPVPRPHDALFENHVEPSRRGALTSVESVKDHSRKRGCS